MTIKQLISEEFASNPEEQKNQAKINQIYYISLSRLSEL